MTELQSSTPKRKEFRRKIIGFETSIPHPGSSGWPSDAVLIPARDSLHKIKIFNISSLTIDRYVITDTLTSRIETRTSPSDLDMDLRTFGTYGGGVSLMTLAWQNLTYELEIKSTKFISDTDKVPRGRVFITNMRCEHRIFEKHPVDILVIDNGTRKAPHGPQTSEHWELILEK